MVYLQHCYITGPIRFCPKICNVGGRMISAPTRTVPLNCICKYSTLHCRRFAPTLFPMGKQPGGYYPLNYCVIAPGDNFILIRYAAHHPYTVCATEFPLGNLMAYARRNFCLVIPNKKAVPKPRFGTANRLTNGVWAVFLHGSRPDGGRCGYRDFLTRAVRREPGCRRRLRWYSPASGRPSRPADRRRCRRGWRRP